MKSFLKTRLSVAQQAHSLPSEQAYTVFICSVGVTLVCVYKTRKRKRAVQIHTRESEISNGGKIGNRTSAKYVLFMYLTRAVQSRRAEEQWRAGRESETDGGVPLANSSNGTRCRPRSLCTTYERDCTQTNPAETFTRNNTENGDTRALSLPAPYTHAHPRPSSL